MVQHYEIEGYDNFKKFFQTFKPEPEGTVFIYFGGTKEEDTGESWCDDCQRAWPVISKLLEKAPSNLHFVHVEVGDRKTWKDPKCSFRTDPTTKLMVLPSLLQWKSFKRLQGDQCEKEELVQMLFEDQEDDD